MKKTNAWGFLTFAIFALGAVFIPWSDAQAIVFVNPLSVDSVEELLASLLSALQGVVVALAMIFIVLGGILYMTSYGNPGRIEQAKACWTGALIGLAIVLVAPTFLKEIEIILGHPQTGMEASALSLRQIITNVLNFLLSIVGVLAIITLVIGGGMLLTSAGDSNQAGTAKKVIGYAIVGLVVSLSALIIVKQVTSLIGG
jgi:hypothetical protein